MPSYEVERLLVEGEVVSDESGEAKRVWPSQREVAARFSVSPSLIAEFSKKHRCAERRAELQAQLTTPPKDDKAPAESANVERETCEEGRGARETNKRRPGRPKKQDAPDFSYEELDRLLVFGEVLVLEDGTSTTVYPTYRQLAERFGVALSVIASYAKSRNCLKRREQTATRVTVRTEEKLIELRAGALAVGEARLVEMIDEFLLKFESALKEGRVRTDSPADVNTLARLKAFITGGADSRQEVRNVLSLEALQERYARAMLDMENATPAMAGVIAARAGVVCETEPPGRSTRDATGEPNLVQSLRDLTRLSRELAGEVDGEQAARLLRAVDAVEAHVAVHDGANVGSRGANDTEDEG